MTYQADHSLLLALPAFAPAVVAWVAIRDRRRPDPADENLTEDTD